MTDLNTLPDDIKQAFNYFIKRVGELELSFILMQSEILNLVKKLETLKKECDSERLHWKSLEQDYVTKIKNYEDEITKSKNKKNKD